jgi:predicted metal-dependent peptidase
MDKIASLSKTSKDLMLKEPYYGFFLIMLNKVWNNNIPTAGVSKHNINFQLAINENFWESLTDNTRKGLLKHELLHIAFNHLTIYFDFADRKMANIAMDMEINQYIDYEWLPEGGVDIDNYPELCLDRKAGCRYYYKMLKKAQKEKEEKGSSGSEKFDNLCDKLDGKPGESESGEGEPGETQDGLPDHSTWEEFEGLSESEKGLMEKQVQKILSDAKDMTEKKRGTVPGEIEGVIIIDDIKPAKFNWKGYIKRFNGTSTKVYTKKLRRKENKRYSDNPGLKLKTRQHLLLGIDTSASVSNDELMEFMNEMHHIYRCGTDITIIQCDTQIKSIKPYKGEKDLVVHGRGGTQFDPVLNYLNENIKTYTSLIYFTDGECCSSVKPKVPTLWVLSERSQLNNSLPGKVIKLEL